MKTMKKGSDVRRVKDEDVQSRLRNGFAYCPKSEWKSSEKVVDVAPIETVVPEPSKGKGKKR